MSKKNANTPAWMIELDSIFNTNYNYVIDNFTRTYCQIHMDEWSTRAMHYEFTIKGRSNNEIIKIALHYEKASTNDMIEAIGKYKHNKIENYSMSYNPDFRPFGFNKDGEGGFCLWLEVPMNEGMNKIASYMNQLIEMTIKEISRFV